MRTQCFLALLLAALLRFSTAGAQNYDSDFYFVYITLDQTSPANLIDLLRQDYRSAIDEEQTWVFWLANGTDPYIVEVSPENPNRETFDEMLEVIGANQRLEYITDEDMEKMVVFFNEHNIVDEDCSILFNSVTWRIYSTPTFWNTERQFISLLYWVFDMQTLSEVNGFNFTFEVYLDRSFEGLLYDEEKPFGEENLGNINEVFQPMDYSDR